jgi:trans-2,3-dihydro-3-hydroxyanthranilate isomerase
MKHRFILTDVFTERAFGGNQLAVFPDGTGISDALMQSFAHELNFSETTFVLPPRKPGHTHRVRIFTPHSELPFAGHPNVGTSVVLAHEGGHRDATRFVFDEDVGTVNVTARCENARGFAELAIEGEAEIRPCGVPPATLARMLSISPDRMGTQPAWTAKVGVPFVCIPLLDFEAVAIARFDTATWNQTFPDGSWARQVYAMAGDFTPGGKIKVRMWGPSVGVAEDPATGAAAAVLAGSLAAGLPDRDGDFTWSIEQGAELGRPSFISASAEKRDGRVVSIRVGGGAVIVGEGWLNAPVTGG